MLPMCPNWGFRYGAGTMGDAAGDCYNLTNLTRIPPADCTRETIAMLRQHEIRADAARRSWARPCYYPIAHRPLLLIYPVRW